LIILLTKTQRGLQELEYKLKNDMLKFLMAILTRLNSA